MRFGVLTLLLLPVLTLPAQAQWDFQDSHTTASLRGIHNVGGGVAWASGTSGTILRTEDGGYLWQICAVPPGAEHLDFRGIQAFDENTAIVVSSGKGDLSRLYRTTDGCKTWTLVLANPDKDGFWDGVVFNLQKPTNSSVDWQAHLRGFLVGDPVDGKFVVYMSIDSGRTWQRWLNNKSERPAEAENGDGLFAASNSAAIATGSHEHLVFVTGGVGGSHLFKLALHDAVDADRYLSFTKTELPMPKGESSGAFSIAARAVGKPENHESDFMVVGGDYRHPDAPGAAVFLPGGRRGCFGSVPQISKPNTPPHGFRSAVAYDSISKTWITVGPNGTDISTDEGKNWRALKPKPGQAADGDKDWNALSLPFVVGPNGRIGKLRDDAFKP